MLFVRRHTDQPQPDFQYIHPITISRVVPE